MKRSAHRAPVRLQLVDSLRALAILLVLAVHWKAIRGPWPSPDPGVQALWDDLSRNGSYGVTLFFVVSGFLITRLLSQSPGGLFRPSVRDFYVRRAARILPLFLVICVLGAGMVYGYGSASFQMNFCFRDPRADFGGAFWLSLSTFSFNWFRIAQERIADTYGLNWDVLWSLSIEEQFYLCYPWLLKKLGHERNLVLFLAGIIMAGPLVRWLCFLRDPHSFLLSFTNSFGAFDSIAWGGLLFLVVRKWGKVFLKNPGVCRLWAITGLGIMVWTYFTTRVEDGLDRIYGPSLLALGAFLFLAGALHLAWAQGKAVGAAASLGHLSYGAYLWHAWVLFLIFPWLKGIGLFPAYGLFASSVAGVAWLSYRYLEQPLNRKVRIFFSGR